ncbi:unnamed protein product, partial [Rotaria sp. Silwood2]
MTKPRKIIHVALLDIHPGNTSSVGNYRSLQRTVEHN